MKQWIQRSLIVLLISWLIGAVAADSGYQLVWYTIDSGGALFSASGSYSLGSTIGQADAGVVGGGGYTLYSGFWGAPDSIVYVPLVTR
ncbi:hypothetical protein [Chloroflexus sp.]|uniref:hypothetical protein n=1 Tax=Chloroflexus sp. TaxID=1904827 RepID=UPI002610F717|nr:hypothetical protein [uncultured Chloroflexus sp.]